MTTALISNGPEEHTQDINAWPSLLASIVMATIGPCVLLIMPLVVGSMMDSLGFDTAQAGMIASVELGGSGLMALIMMNRVRKLPWRTLAGIGLCVMLVANLVSMWIDSFIPLLGIRVLAGLGSGLLMVVAYAHLSDTRDPDRGFGLIIVSQLVVSIAVFSLLPDYIARLGLPVIYGLLAGIVVLGLCLRPFLPNSGIQRPEHIVQGNNSSLRVFSGLGGIVAFFLCIGGFWAYIERIGLEAGLTSTDIGNALAISTIGGLLGASAASWMGSRYSRLAPLLIVAISHVGCLMVLQGEMSLMLYMLSNMIFQFFWCFAISFQMGAVNDADPTGRMVLLCSPAQALGLTIGPSLAGFLASGAGFQTSEVSYLPVNILSIISALLCFALFLPLLLQSRSQGS